MQEAISSFIKIDQNDNFGVSLNFLVLTLYNSTFIFMKLFLQKLKFVLNLSDREHVF